LGEIRLILFEEENKLSITIIEAKNLKDSKSLNQVPCKFKNFLLPYSDDMLRYENNTGNINP
jgi:hypothetical protein